MNRRSLVTCSLAVMLGILVAGSAARSLLAGQSTTAKTTKAPTPASAKSARTAAPPAPVIINVGPVTDVDTHKAFGSKSAPVIMEVFSDFQCPACKNLYLSTNRQLMDSYVNTGKVYLIHRDYPLPMHAHSRVAASYARAAAQIGRGEPVEQALFENQEKWEASGDVDGIVASALSAADMKKVRDLVNGKTFEPLIEKDAALGRMHNVNQTPTMVFYSKGQTYPYAGQITYEFLKQFLDQLLAQR